MSWTHNDVEMLIENVQKHPCLYKVRDVIYKNKHARNSAWESILNEMKTFRPSSTLLELKTKFRGLKCSFNQEYKKAMFKKSGSGTDDLYTPTLWYYEKLLFLQDNVMPRSAYVDSIEIENVEDDVFNDSFENFTQGEDIGLNFEVCEHLGISNESDYFGLKYEGRQGEELWLNLRNPIDRQVQIHGHNAPLRFALRVKFWVPPHLLLQETTRHQFYLHAKLDLIEKRLIAHDWDTVAKLIALIAQAEVGDYDARHPPCNIYSQAATITKLEPDDKPQDLLQRVMAHHRACKEMKASTAEYWLLKEVATLEGFGQELFHSKTTGGILGVGPHGISVYEKDRDKQVLPFTAIQSASSHKRIFTLEYMNMDNTKSILEYKLESNHYASSLYRAITEKHAFYSCETVRSAVTAQFIRDLKGTIVSIFNEDSSLGKKYVFDIKRTCREVYDNARRALYQESQMLAQNINELPAGGCDGESCKDSHERLTRLLDAMTCRICMDCQIDTAFLPCAHVVACSTCASKCDRCPLCRADITQAQKIYLPGEFRMEMGEMTC